MLFARAQQEYNEHEGRGWQEVENGRLGGYFMALSPNWTTQMGWKVEHRHLEIMSTVKALGTLASRES